MAGTAMAPWRWLNKDQTKKDMGGVSGATERGDRAGRPGGLSAFTRHDMVDRRLTLLAAVVVFWAAAIFSQLIRLQVIRHREYLGKADARQEVSIEIAAPRGAIYDRSGRC